MYKMLRFIKRGVFTEGFSSPVYEFLKELRAGNPNTFHPDDGRFLINISFDLEFGFNSPLWERSSSEAVNLGKIAKHNLLPTLAFFKKENIPLNVQVVCGLIADDFISQPFCLEKQRNTIIENRPLFEFSLEERKALVDSDIELGIHGFSHRRFSNLSQGEAETEIKKSVELVNTLLGSPPRFMSFPKNDVAHLSALKGTPIKSWRSNHQDVSLLGEIPVGLWFSPGNISSHDMARLLEEIKILRPQGYFLHLWSHFTEIESGALEEIIKVICGAGFSFTTFSEYLDDYKSR